jgi:hypothetical protein
MQSKSPKSPKTVKSPTFTYPMSYALNRQNVKKFIAASAPDARDAVRKFIKATTHISFETFITYINKSFRELVKLVPDGRPVFVYIDVGGWIYEYKSNYWIFLYIRELAKTKHNLETIFVSNLDNHILNNNDVILLVDDCIYSGEQMSSTVNRLTNYSKKHFKLVLFALFMSEVGYTRVFNSKVNNSHLVYSEIVIPKYVHFIKPLSEYMTLDEMMTIMKYYLPPDDADPYDKIDVAMASRAELRKYPVYFDHKLADNTSTFPRIYAGVVPRNYSYSKVLLLQPQIKNEEEDLRDMRNYGKAHTQSYKQRYAAYMELQQQYKEEFNKILFFPLIKNCEHYNDMVKLESSCPPPPYKKKYNDFIAIFRKVKKEESAIVRSARSLPSMRSRRSVPTKPSSTPQNTKSPGTRISSQSLASRSRKPQSASF